MDQTFKKEKETLEFYKSLHENSYTIKESKIGEGRIAVLMEFKLRKRNVIHYCDTIIGVSEMYFEKSINGYVYKRLYNWIYGIDEDE